MSQGAVQATPATPCPPGCIEAPVAQRLVAAASDLALTLDPEGTILEVSIGDSLGPQPALQALAGRRWVDTIAPDSRSKVEQFLRDVRSGAVPRQREINQRFEGGELPLRCSAVLLGQDGRVLVLGRDLRPVSAMQQQMVAAQQMMDREFARLRQAETRYRLLFQITSEGVLIAEASALKVVESNPAAAALFDEPVQVLQGSLLQDLFRARDWGAVKAMLASVEAGGKPPEVQVRLPSQGREGLVSGSLFRQSGAVLFLLRVRPVGVDQAPGGIRAARMLAVLDALPDGFAVIGEDRRILSANSAFCDLVQMANEGQVVGQPLDRWLGRPGVDMNILLANLREHGSVRNFATIINGDFGASQEAVVSAVSALDAKLPCMGFVIRPVTVRLQVVPPGTLAPPRSVDQLRELVGRVSLKEIVRESTDLIERLCIEAALKVSNDNRASAAQLLGLSRQGLYSKLRRHGLGDLDPTEVG
jgi:transcriptional regulator PpsR